MPSQTTRQKSPTSPTTNITVHKGPLLDGIGKSTQNVVQISNTTDSNVAQILKDTKTEIVINLLPSGATKASQHYAEQALTAGCAFLNATPNFIASDAAWAKRFRGCSLALGG